MIQSTHSMNEGMELKLCTVESIPVVRFQTALAIGCSGLRASRQLPIASYSPLLFDLALFAVIFILHRRSTSYVVRLPRWQAGGGEIH